MSDDQRKDARRWIDEAEEALNRTGEALRSAWSKTKEERMATLEAAREAAARLGKAIDHGIEAARETWDASERQQSPDQGYAEGEPGSSPVAPYQSQEEE
jgi:hypothetical protein